MEKNLGLLNVKDVLVMVEKKNIEKDVPIKKG